MVVKNIARYSKNMCVVSVFSIIHLAFQKKY